MNINTPYIIQPPIYFSQTAWCSCFPRRRLDTGMTHDTAVQVLIVKQVNLPLEYASF